MEEGFSIIIIMFLLFVSDSIFLISNGSFVLKKNHFKYKSIYNLEKTNSFNRVIVFLNVLPPFGEFFELEKFPILFSETRFFFGENSGGNVLDWENFKNIEIRNREIFLKGKQIKKITNVSTIKKLLNFLEEGLDHEEAIKRIYRIRNNRRLVDKRIKLIRFVTRNLRFCCTIHWVVLFVYIPLMIFYFGLSTVWPFLIVVGYSSTLIVSFAYFALHRRLYREASFERISNLARMLLCPPAAIRACDYITRYYLEIFSPKMVSSVLLGDKDLKLTLKKLYIDICYPINYWADCDDLNGVFDFYHSHEKDIFHSGLKALNIPIEELTCEIEKLSSDCKCYCPRCCGQFVKELTTCPDCYGVDVVKY